MSILYYASGTQWWCRRCKTTVRAAKGGGGECACKDNPEYIDVHYEGSVVRETVNASPWEPVCRKCLHLYRSRRGERAGLKRLKLPFSDEKVWRLSLFGWTVEWAYGSCATDVSKITASANRVRRTARQTDIPQTIVYLPRGDE
jgi:hypothetical protein